MGSLDGHTLQDGVSNGISSAQSRTRSTARALTGRYRNAAPVAA
jgi:hypothetical protein